MNFTDPQHYPNMMMVGSNSITNNFTPSMPMAPITAQFPFFNNNNILHYSDPNNNNYNDINNDILKPCDVAVESFERKRGRPRKHSPPDGDTFLGSTSTHMPPSSSSSIKESRGRGRPLGSGKKQLSALGHPVAANLTPHVLFVKPGEDVAAKIMAFCGQIGRTVFILSANGRVGNVTLQHVTGGEGGVTYEGNYSLITLSGSFQQPRNNSGCTGMGGLRVSLGGLDGRVVGGKIIGEFIATSTVQVVLASFIAD